MATKNSWNNTITDANVTLNGGTVSIGTDSVDNAIDIGTAASSGRSIDIGNTTGTTSINLFCGTGDFSLQSATGTIISAADTGEINYSLQPSFLAYNSTTDTNATGVGAVFQLEFDTEVFDQNADYDNTTDTFTAPVTGRYMLGVSGRVNNSGTGCDIVDNYITTSNRVYSGSYQGGGAMPSTDTQSFGTWALADMDAADTATSSVVASGATSGMDDMGVVGGASPITYFCGQLLA